MIDYTIAKYFLPLCNPKLIENMFKRVRAEKENIVLIGMPGSGKSTVGKILGERLGRKLVDTDELIIERIGMSIKDFFALHGEEAFREVESLVISELANQNGLIISTGGGAVLRENNVSALKYNGRLFFIDRPVEKLIPTDTRPLSSDKDAIERRYKERYSIYCGTCDVKVNADCDAAAVANRIMENLRDENLHY